MQPQKLTLSDTNKLYTDPIEEELTAALNEFQPDQPTNNDDILRRLQAKNVELLEQIAANSNNPKKPKDEDWFVKISGVGIIGIWVLVNMISGATVTMFGAEFEFQPEANFKSTLQFLAITAAGLILGTNVRGGPKAPKA